MSNYSDLPLRVICATQAPLDKFYTDTLTGQSLSMLKSTTPMEATVYAENTRGLSEVYNQAIRDAQNDPCVLVFMHDDLLIQEFFWGSRVYESLTRFDIVGLAGNIRRLPAQPAWWAAEVKPTGGFRWDRSSNLSGVVGHLKINGADKRKISVFGPRHLECKILDGLFLAAKSETLVANNVLFDEQFKFHFYDMDFCRTAERAGLRMGTCELSLFHDSGGSYDASWRATYEMYLEKWRS